ncbi:diguanylate cyclase domain-containing protein [Actinomycetospora atypica]|uniref:Diguanylate cyclase domain-containing protein n=1 Tax=Actinomycetospora atypica TaxID=1290095 RepID=A0ABV9YNW2_9PSEU
MLLPSADQWEQRCERPEERLDRLVEFVVELASGHLEARMAPSSRADELDSVIVGLNMLAEELQVLNDDLEKRVRERTRELATAREQLQHLALHDPLTNLANRTLLTDRLAAAVDEGSDTAPPAVIVLDLDGFKAVNDDHGHAVGDRLLVVVAARLRGAVRARDTVARLGGDEFAVVVVDAVPHEVVAVARRIQHRLRRPVVVSGHRCTVDASIGIRFGTDRPGPSTLLDDADLAMYAAKESGGGVRIFEPSLRPARRERRERANPAADPGPADPGQLALFEVAPFEDPDPDGGPRTAL